MSPQDDAQARADPPEGEAGAVGSGQGRKGRALPFFAFLAIGAVAAVVAFGWGAALLSYDGQAHNVPHQLVAWTATSDHEVSVTFQVGGGEPAVCLLTATDERHVEVGQEEVQVDAGEGDVTHTLETTRRASAVDVASCRSSDR